MSRMIKNLMVVLMAAVMFFTSALTPVRAEDVPEEPVETVTEETLEQETEDTTQNAAETGESLGNSEEPDDIDAAVDENAIVEIDEVVENDAEILADQKTFEEESSLQFSLNSLASEQTAEINAGGFKAADEKPTINATKTVLDTDGDGIYELSLNIKATSQTSSSTSAPKSNVVIVIDVSGSMDEPSSYPVYTYNASTYDASKYRYRGVDNNGEYFPVSYSTYYSTWIYSDGYNTYRYSGTVYGGVESRLSATKSAAIGVVDALLGYNKADDDNLKDVFEISVVKFANKTASGNYNGTSTIIKNSTDKTAIENAIKGLSAGGGTNWQAALELAKSEADYYKNETPSEATSVIFLTDGFPTFYGNDNGYTVAGHWEGWSWVDDVDYAGQEQADNIALCYENSRAAARSIVSSGYKLYNIFAFGSDTKTFNTHTGYQYLSALTNYAYGQGDTDDFSTTTQNVKDYCFNAKSTEALIAAFETIIDHITNNVGYAGVNFTDGVSLGATSTSVAVNGTAKEESLRYTVKDENDKVAYTVTIKNNKATFVIYGADGEPTSPTYEATGEQKTTVIEPTIGDPESINTTLYSVTVGEGENAKTYQMSPAVIDPQTGMVQWNLAALGILQSGYTYTVSFDVWPNQTAYDIAADMNNGVYETVDAALDDYGITNADDRKHIKEALVLDEGKYYLYTNYEQKIEYYPAESSTNDQGETTWTYSKKQEDPVEKPKPIPLEGSKLFLQKAWNASLKQSEVDELLWKDGVVGGTSNEYWLKLYVWKADTPEELNQAIAAGTDPYIEKVLGWDGDEYDWLKEAAVAPGMMVNLEEAKKLGFDTTDQSKLKEFVNDEGVTLTYYVIEKGHYYYVTEAGKDLHFELDTDLYHPMIVDGTLKNVFFGDGKEVKEMVSMTNVVATNTLKGGLNIDKVVSTTKVIVKDGELDGVTEPEEECEDEFAYIIKLWKEDDTGAISPVYTFDDQFENDGKTAISGSIGYREMGAKDENDENITLGRNVIVFEDSTNAAAKIEANKRGVNEPVYATLTDDNKTQLILRMPANGEIRIVNLPSGTKYTVEEILDESGVYNYGATERSVLPEGSAAPVITEENTVSGTISGNKANVEKYYNWTDSYFYVYHSADNTVEKIAFTDSRVKGTYEDISEEGEEESVYGYVYRFNIVDEVKDEAEPEGTPSVRDFLYGGYYQDYTGKSANFNAADLTYNENADKKLWADDTGSGKYPYIGNKTDDWDIKEVYRVKGTEMIAKPDTTYYLKEVPNYYLKPYTHFTYYKSNNKINYMWFMSGIDDPNYNGVGFEIAVKDADGTLEPATSVCANLRITNNGGTVKLNAYNVYHQYGMVNQAYLAYYKGKMNTKYVKPDTTLHIRQFWETPDGITEFGITTRTITIDKTGNYKNLVYSDAE